MAEFNEKAAIPPTDPTDHIKEKDIIRDTEVQGTTYDFAVSKDGIKIHPQPTSDPLDPLNWSTVKKHTILGIVMFKYASPILSSHLTAIQPSLKHLDTLCSPT